MKRRNLGERDEGSVLEIQSLLWKQAAARSSDGADRDLQAADAAYQPGSRYSARAPPPAGLTTAAAPVTQQLADGRLAVGCTWSSQPNGTCLDMQAV